MLYPPPQSVGTNVTEHYVLQGPRFILLIGYETGRIPSVRILTAVIFGRGTSAGVREGFPIFLVQEDQTVRPNRAGANMSSVDGGGHLRWTLKCGSSNAAQHALVARGMWRLEHDVMFAGRMQSCSVFSARPSRMTLLFLLTDSWAVRRRTDSICRCR